MWSCWKRRDAWVLILAGIGAGGHEGWGHAASDATVATRATFPGGSVAPQVGDTTWQIAPSRQAALLLRTREAALAFLPLDLKQGGEGAREVAERVVAEHRKRFAGTMVEPALPMDIAGQPGLRFLMHDPGLRHPYAFVNYVITGTNRGLRVVGYCAPHDLWDAVPRFDAAVGAIEWTDWAEAGEGNGRAAHGRGIPGDWLRWAPLMAVVIGVGMVAGWQQWKHSQRK